MRYIFLLGAVVLPNMVLGISADLKLEFVVGT